MDRKSIIGLGIIGLILVMFTLLNRPSEAELKKQQEKAKKEKLLAENEEKAEQNKESMKIDNDKQSDSLSITKSDTTPSQIIRLESDKLIVDINTKGANVEAVYLKRFKSYRYFKLKNNKIRPLKLFGENDSKNNLSFEVSGKKINTSDYNFEIIKNKNNTLKLALDLGAGKKLIYRYQLQKNVYDLKFDISHVGLDEAKFMMNLKTDLYKTERLLSEQKRVSTICFKHLDKKFDYLSEIKDDEKKLEDKVEWIAYKQSYFSTILKPEIAFGNKDAKLKITNFKEGNKKFHSHIKRYESDLSLNFSKENKLSFSWFFGPNDFELLKSYHSDYEDIINYGWGIFRWINIYAIQPMFNVLAETGLGFGLVILLLTLIIKLILMPIQWKMYVSSAKMKILKPEIDILNAKYPKKEDAMKKQSEMMSMYRESGASPLAGCVPMLIQMPILLAVFRFFPAAFELRQKGFLWAEDLSSYDSIYDFGTYIWPYGDHISLFTLLMSATTLIYTWQNSGSMQQAQQPGMPNMKVMMYIFPVMMIFFFNNYSSGLSYYYFISTLISIILMLIIKKFFVDEEKLKAKMAAKKATSMQGGGKKKSKFQEKLEQMQKAQQDRMKQMKK